MEKTNTESAFPEVDLDAEFNPSKLNNFPVDPVSSEVDTSKELQKVADARAEAKEDGKREAMQTVKSAFVISGIIVAAIVAAGSMIVKNLKQT
ncbi:uncharacterized protein [Aristolochia californica]|uniref:uncharacterized protein n=1 Tax=Aristolochia californica TaxID=171875 RepID=UPI0035D6A883